MNLLCLVYHVSFCYVLRFMFAILLEFPVKRKKFMNFLAFNEGEGKVPLGIFSVMLSCNYIVKLIKFPTNTDSTPLCQKSLLDKNASIVALQYPPHPTHAHIHGHVH